MTRTLSFGPNGFQVSDDVDDLLGSFLNTHVLGDHASEIETMFAPDGEGFYIPSLGGAMRIRDRDDLSPPFDEDPALNPERDELWVIDRERPFHAPLQIVLTGDELRALLAEAQRIAVEHRG